MELKELAQTILSRLQESEAPLSPSDERQLIEQACSRVPAEWLLATPDPVPGKDIVQEENEGAMTGLLELRLRNLLSLHHMTPQDYAHLREQLVYRAYRQERNWTRAEDLVQETFLAMITNRHQYRGDSTYMTWVQSILFNRMTRMRQGAAHRREIPIEVHTEAGDGSDVAMNRLMEWMLEAQVGSESPEMRHVEQERVNKLLNLLPRLLTGRYELESINLVMLQELEYDEAAELLKISRDYLYKIVCGARRKLLACQQIRAIMEDRDAQQLPDTAQSSRHKRQV